MENCFLTLSVRLELAFSKQKGRGCFLKEFYIYNNVLVLPWSPIILEKNGFIPSERFNHWFSNFDFFWHIWIISVFVCTLTRSCKFVWSHSSNLCIRTTVGICICRCTEGLVLKKTHNFATKHQGMSWWPLYGYDKKSRVTVCKEWNSFLAIRKIQKIEIIFLVCTQHSCCS